MPKVFKFEVGDRVEVTDIQGAFIGLYNGLRGTVKELLDVSQYDYRVEVDGGGQTKFKESELSKLYEYEYKPKIGDLVRLKTTGEEGIIVTIDNEHNQAEMRFNSNPNLYQVYGFNKYEIVENGEVEVEETEIGKFEKLATELGKFTDMKNKQYGSSVDATYEMVKVLMDRYTYDENRYLIPKELLSHLLLTVRVMDKQNRIFNNPSGKGDSESPWKDILGYSLIGVEMVERI